MAYSVGDDVGCVAANRQLVCDALRIPMDGLTLGSQTHGARVEIVASAARGRGGHCGTHAIGDTDGLVTNLADTCLMVLVADCVPVLLCDPRRRVVAAVHAGWRGTASRIVTRAVDLMVVELGCRPSDILAGLGPAIAKADYEVGTEVIAAIASAVPAGIERVASESGPGKWMLDLHEANRLLLREAGLPDENIELAPGSTYTDRREYFSARRDGVRTGRIGAGIMLCGDA
jgi:YfiH family protein